MVSSSLISFGIFFFQVTIGSFLLKAKKFRATGKLKLQKKPKNIFLAKIDWNVSFPDEAIRGINFFSVNSFPNITSD